VNKQVFTYYLFCAELLLQVEYLLFKMLQIRSILDFNFLGGFGLFAYIYIYIVK
jgi:hypothetical protein